MAEVSSGTPEAVALELLEQIASTEKWNQGAGDWKKSRDHILGTYRQCLRAAKGLDWADLKLPAD